MRTGKTLALFISIAVAPRAAESTKYKAPARMKRVIETPTAKVYYGKRIKGRGIRVELDVQKPFEMGPGSARLTLEYKGVVPGLVVAAKRGVRDKANKLLKPGIADARRITTTEQLLKGLKADFSANKSYLLAEGVQEDREHVALRRTSELISGYHQLIRSNQTGLSAQERASSVLALVNVHSHLIYSIRYAPKVGEGVAADYHPYSRPFDKGVAKLKEIASDEVGIWAIRNNLSYIYRRKTTRAGSQIREWDLEASLGMRIVADTSKQEPVSMKKGTEHNALPEYVVLSVKTSGLPTALREHAGKSVMRDGAKYYLDGTSTELPASIEQHLIEKPIDYTQTTNRDLKTGETARANFKFPWTGEYGITPFAINTGWWGHCHIEAILAALGVEAKSQVTYFNAESKKMAHYDSAALLNDTLFAMFDTSRMADMTARTVLELDRVEFHGNRNDGREGFADGLRIRTGSGTRNFDSMTLRQVFDRQNSQTATDATYLFHENVPNATGPLTRNPDFVRTEQGDINVIKGDRRITYNVKVPKVDSEGMVVERRFDMDLDPAKNERVLVGGDHQQQGTTKIVDWYFYNPGKKTIEKLTWHAELDAQGKYTRKLINGTETGAAPAGDLWEGVTGKPKFDTVATGVTGFEMSREMQAEGAQPITRFLEKAIRYMMGLVVEKSPDDPVWNYPGRDIRVADKENPASTAGFIDEAGKTFDNLGRTRARANETNKPLDVARTTERLTASANGSSADLQRELDPATGRVSKAEFLSPFLDFVWLEKMKYALPAHDGRTVRARNGVINYDALKRGMLYGWKDGKPVQTNDFFRLSSDLHYASNVLPTAPHVWAIGNADDTLEYFDTQAEFEARVRELGGQIPPAATTPSAP